MTRRKKHRGHKSIDKPMPIGKIERNFDKQMQEKELYKEIFAYGSIEPTINIGVSHIYTDDTSLKPIQRLPGSYGSAFK